MSSVAELAIVLKRDIIDEHEYDMNDVILEYALRLYGDVFDDLIWDMDDEGVLLPVKQALDNEGDWQRALALATYWHLDELMEQGYFRE